MPKVSPSLLPKSAHSSERRPPRRALYFMSLLMLLMTFGVVGVSRFALNSTAETILADLKEDMAARAQAKVFPLAAWCGSISDQAARLADSDPVRLFASEANRHEYDASALLSQSLVEEEDSRFAFQPNMDQLDDQARLGAQAPLMRRQLEDFILRHSMVSAALFNTRGDIYLSAGAAFHPGASEAARATLHNGAAQILPAQLDPQGRMIMDMIFPVVAPLYVDESGKKMVGVLVLGVDLSSQITKLTSLAQSNDASRESGRILQVSGQKAGKTMQALPADGSAPLNLPGWEAPAPGEVLELAQRVLPEPGGMERMVYALALPVPNTPLFVEQDVPIDVANAQYQAFRQSVLLSATLVVLVVALLLVMLWWWLLGRRDRAVAAELRELYGTVTRQNQIIEGVNTTMKDGIVLSDDAGRFLYANQAFACMAGETPASLATRTCATLSNIDIAHNIRAHTNKVRRADTPLTFTDALHANGSLRSYQIACSPFRNDADTMIGVVSVYRDITDLLDAQARAQHMVNQTVHVFVRAIEAVDPYLRGQSTQTGVLAIALAEKLGLSNHASTLRTAAQLSQIGMIQLPRTLLTKIGKLTEAERTQLEKHVDYARDALDDIDFGYPVLEAITQMHERLDGSGYPHHLIGEAIGQDGRILAVASTFCAMLRPRSYREARSAEQAMHILSFCPPQYDPDVVQALRGYLQSPEGQNFQRELTASD